MEREPCESGELKRPAFRDYSGYWVTGSGAGCFDGTLTIYTKDSTKLSGPLPDLIAESDGRIEVVKCL